MNLSYNQITDFLPLMKCIEEGFCVLEHLDISFNPISNPNSLVSIFTHSSRLIYCNSSGIGLEDIPASWIDALSKRSTVKSLNLSHNRIKDVDQFAVVFSQNHTLNRLDLSSNQPRHVRRLCEELKQNHGLQWLNLSNNEIEDEECIAELIKQNGRLVSIDLNENRLKKVAI